MESDHHLLYPHKREPRRVQCPYMVVLQYLQHPARIDYVISKYQHRLNNLHQIELGTYVMVESFQRLEHAAKSMGSHR
uniref:Uncharacterized protein n=1 Tax=Megaselia scalaris TaxID=36166 RepID=T1GZK1_MEGSC